MSGYTRVSGTPLITVKGRTFGVWMVSGTPLGGFLVLAELLGPEDWMGRWTSMPETDEDIARKINEMGVKKYISYFTGAITQALHNLLADYTEVLPTVPTTVYAGNYAQAVNTELHNSAEFQIAADGSVKLALE